MSFIDWALSKGFKPETTKPATKLTSHDHLFQYVIANPAAPGTVDFSDGAFLATDPQWNNIFGGGSNQNVIFRMDSIKIDVYGDTFTIAKPEDKAAFFAGMSLRVKSAGQTMRVPLYPACDEPYTDLQSAASYDQMSALIQSQGLELDEPVTVNLEDDDLQIEFGVNPPQGCTLLIQVEGYGVSATEIEDLEVGGVRVRVPGATGFKQRARLLQMRRVAKRLARRK